LKGPKKGEQFAIKCANSDSGTLLQGENPRLKVKKIYRNPHMKIHSENILKNPQTSPSLSGRKIHDGKSLRKRNKFANEKSVGGKVRPKTSDKEKSAI
jgi:hypothetical protein